MTLTLLLPERGLWPNARLHHMRKAALVRRARERAHLLALAMLSLGPNAYARAKSEPWVVTYALDFWFPDRRRRDDDNAIAATKAYRDGIADALGIDDHDMILRRPPTMNVDRLDPRLEIDLRCVP